MEQFIKTSDAETAERLRKECFTELGKEGNMFVFLNSGKMNFETTDRSKMVFTNIACMTHS